MNENKGKIAVKHVFVGDDHGHYGHTSCSLCGFILNDKDECKECPNCGATLEGIDVSFNTGTSDYL